MLFTELRFPLFFLIACSVYWLLPRNGQRKLWCLVCSYAFYAAWDVRFLSLIIASTLIDYIVGLRLVRPGARRRAWLGVSLAGNLGLLGFFKYYNFFVDSAADLLVTLGLEPNVHTLQIILPVGISFYTFQTLSYTLDIYFERFQPTRKLLDLAVFVAFFPQLVAGPIVRARDFLPQLQEKRVLARVDVRGALVLFMIGFIKKACISDNLATVVDVYFRAPERYDVLTAWVATLYYAVQIYCDFSGYSDMAIACAALFGFRLCLNFHFPYFAGDITEFWRRWHISLSSWLRDYLYIPLGGNRGSRLFIYRNLLLTMLLGGLWHGAAWNFVLWGGLHGLGLIAHRQWRERVREGSTLRRVVGWIGMPLTFYFVCIGWILFRSVGMEEALDALRAFVLLDSPGSRSLGRPFVWLFPALVLVHGLAYRRWLATWWRGLPGWAFAAAYALVLALGLPFVSVDLPPFIYFQF